MLPLSLLKTAEGQPMLIELKNGDTYNGRLVRCDMFMNINLKDVICTSKDGDRFWKMPECYIRGSSVKYLRIPDEVIAMVIETDQTERKTATRGGRGGRSGGRLPSRAPTGTGRGGGGGGGGRGDRASMGSRGGRGGRDGSYRGRGSSGAPPPGIHSSGTR